MEAKELINRCQGCKHYETFNEGFKGKPFSFSESYCNVTHLNIFDVEDCNCNCKEMNCNCKEKEQQK